MLLMSIFNNYITMFLFCIFSGIFFFFLQFGLYGFHCVISLKLAQGILLDTERICGCNNDKFQ